MADISAERAAHLESVGARVGFASCTDKEGNHTFKCSVYDVRTGEWFLHVHADSEDEALTKAMDELPSAQRPKSNMELAGENDTLKARIAELEGSVQNAQQGSQETAPTVPKRRGRPPA